MKQQAVTHTRQTLSPATEVPMQPAEAGEVMHSGKEPTLDGDPQACALQALLSAAHRFAAGTLQQA